jgi:hypothetical protein
MSKTPNPDDLLVPFPADDDVADLDAGEQTGQRRRT